MSAAEILEGIRAWVEIESHTADLAGVQAMVAEVEGAYRALGAATEREPGQNGYGDHLIVRAPWNDHRPGILILSHLDTVYPKGTLARMPFAVAGDKAFGPGIYDMKGGAYIAFDAVGRFLKSGKAAPLPVTHLFLSDEEIGSPTSRPLIERLARESKVVLVTEPAREGGKVVTARKGVARYDLETFGVASHAGASLRKAGLAVAINEMLKRRSVAEWLRRGPVAGCEMRVADEEQFDLRARLVEPAQLGKACREETARARTISLIPAQCLDSCFVFAGRILRLAERQIVPAWRKRVQPACLADVLKPLPDPSGQDRDVG